MLICKALRSITMPLLQKHEPPPLRLIVNLYQKESVGRGSVLVWKVQMRPTHAVRTGQVVQFETDIVGVLAGGNSGTPAVVLYEGRVGSVVDWEKQWVKFSVGEGPSHGGFLLWVPFDWTALTMSLRLQHFIRKASLANNMPSPPAVTNRDLQTRRLETTQAETIRGLRTALHMVAESRFSED